MKLIERTLHTKVDYDPLGHLNEGQKKLVKFSVELEVILQKDEREEENRGQICDPAGELQRHMAVWPVPF